MKIISESSHSVQHGSRVSRESYSGLFLHPLLVFISLLILTLGLVGDAQAFVMPQGIGEGDLIRGPDGVKVWIINSHGFKRHIVNPAVFSLYGHLRWENIKNVDEDTLRAFTTSDLYRADGDPRVYVLQEKDAISPFVFASGTKHWIDMSAAEFVQHGYPWEAVFVVNAAERDYYQTGNIIKALPVLLPSQLTYVSKPDWKTVRADDGSYAFDFPERYPLGVTHFDDVVECKPQTEPEIYTVDNFVTTISVYGYRLENQSLEEAVYTNPKIYTDGRKINTGFSRGGEGAIGGQFLGDQRLTINGRPALYQLGKWVTGGPFGTIFRHTVWVEENDRFYQFTVWVVEPFAEEHRGEIIDVLASFR